MLIACPACASEYEIEADRLGAKGRSVRCAACRETWFIAPDLAGRDGRSAETEGAAERPGSEAETDGGIDAAAEATAAAPTSSEVETRDAGVVDQPMPYNRRPKSAPRNPGRPRAGRALSPTLAAGAAVLAMLPLALLGRTTVVQAMPETAGLFASIGLSVNLRGVAFRDVVAFQTAADGEKPAELVVEGDLIGAARERAVVPEITIEVRDAADRPIRHWTVPAPRATLENAETARFKASLPAPPAQGRSVKVRFAQAGAEQTAQTPADSAEHVSTPHADAAEHAADARHAPAQGH